MKSSLRPPLDIGRQFPIGSWTPALLILFPLFAHWASLLPRLVFGWDVLHGRAVCLQPAFALIGYCVCSDWLPSVPYPLLNILNFAPDCKPPFCAEPAASQCRHVVNHRLHRTKTVWLPLRSSRCAPSSILGPQSHPNVTSPHGRAGLSDLSTMPTATKAEALVMLPWQTWELGLVAGLFCPSPWHGSLADRSQALLRACGHDPQIYPAVPLRTSRFLKRAGCASFAGRIPYEHLFFPSPFSSK